MPDCYLFAGPSLSERAQATAHADGSCLLPPVARGEVAHLAAKRTAGIVVIADGRFHEAMSVGHAELRDAVARGWQVWGVSSLGAIRAYELRRFGMRGYGHVYRMFFRVQDFQDDEVALLHAPDPPYREGSEPLVHMRVALAWLARHELLEPSAARSIVQVLKRRWYGERTLALFAELLRASTATRRWTSVKREIENFDRFRIKQKDLAALLTARPWSSSLAG